MHHIKDSIKKRRSIRKYFSRKVSTDILRQVLEAAGWAPSVHNAQPWRFIVLTDAPLKRALSEAMADVWVADMIKDGIPCEVRENQCKTSVERFTHAPVLIVACITMKDMIKYADEKRQRNERDLAVQSLGAALQNLLLVAHANGLGACWFCAPIFCKETIRKILKIPDDVEPQALITLGYPSEKPYTPSRKLLENYFYLDYWGKKL
ncbi:MAG: nitroreductase family protein [Candidatus Bathyarchaeota archaeon]|nr:MAG: nitroreductase family protein [Candidatus Bathyarchaeota archaeon]